MNPLKRFFSKSKTQKRLVRPRTVRDFASATSRFAAGESTSFACIDLVSSSLALLSYGVYSRKTHKKIGSHWLLSLVNEPNLEETHFTFFSQLVRDYYAGNIFLKIVRNEEGKIVSLFRLNPQAVTVFRDLSTNEKIYNSAGERCTDRDILHIPAPYGYDGLCGHAIFSELDAVFQTARNLNAYTDSSFANNLGKRLIIDISESYPDASDDDLDKVREHYIDTYAGAKNAGVPIVNSGKTKFDTLDTGASDNRANELKENREFQDAQVSQVFHVPTAFLKGEVSGDIEGLYTTYASFAIEPIATAIQQGLNRLLSAEERAEVFFEFSYSSLLRTSLVSRVDAYSKQLQTGQITIDEIRRAENRAEFGTKAAQTAMIPANLMPVRDDVFDAYMASAKERAAKLIENDTNDIGDDKK